MPESKPCIFRFDRVFDGNIGSGGNISGEPWKRGYKVSKYKTTLAWRITAGTNCDQSKQIFSITGLTGEGTTTIRDDGFAYFYGNCNVIKKDWQQPEIIHFKGNIELLHKIGSHQWLNEICDQNEHIEGWLVAQGQGGLSAYSLRAIVVCKGTLPGSGLLDVSANRITGTLYRV